MDNQPRLFDDEKKPRLTKPCQARNERDNKLKAFTEYPILRLGDKYAEPARVREVEILAYDRNKYCMVRVEGLNVEIKRGYLHKTPEINYVDGNVYTPEECVELEYYDCTDEKWNSL